MSGTTYRSRKRIHVTICSMFKMDSNNKEQDVDGKQIAMFFKDHFGVADQDIKYKKGLKVDRLEIKTFFEKPFDVTDKDTKGDTDQNVPEIIKALQNREADRYDFFFYVFLTNLLPEGGDHLQFREDTYLGIDEIFDIIKIQKGVRLKPKIYLIQADDNSFIPVITKGGSETQKVVTRKIPQDADRLVIMSTIPQKFAQQFIKRTERPVIQPDTQCSFLIQAFIKAMRDHKTEDLLTLTTYMNGEVAEMIKPFNDLESMKAKPLPIPLVTSTLTKLVYLQ